VRHRSKLVASVLLSTGLLAAVVSAPAMAASATQHKHHKGTVIASRHTKLGRVLTNSKGRVLYIFGKDGKKKSHCSGACATVWPKVMSKAKPRAGKDVRAKHLSRTAKHQATYYGHPLYYFADSKKPGNTSGEGLNHFFVVSVHGKPIKPKKKAPAGPKGPAVVSTGVVGASSTEVLTNKSGRTLYALTTPNEKATYYCTGGCLNSWVPLLTKGAPTATGDAMASLLGSVKRAGIGSQVTYHGFPVYSYVGDTSAGTDIGEGIPGPGLYPPPNQKWEDITPAGAFNPTP
jgi:predicted lipoprotein with Yx(FWY)xxD motif